MPVDYSINNADSYNNPFPDSGDASPYSKAQAGQTANPDALSVSDALKIAKTAFESIRLRIVGEVSEISNKPGYKAVYFTIKDKSSALPCLMWKSKFDAYGADITVGSKVEVAGKFSLYAAKGRMNFDVDIITLAGEGELRMQVARLAKKLQAEGLCDPAIKKEIPTLPKRIGLVTSPRGAVVHDVIRTLNNRMPIAQIVFAGCAVEGDKAPADMSKALALVDSADVDVIILCRGGGSFEDLMPFNDESLARKIASLNTPVVTGIGHEPDTTIADLVSDKRASTPTAAAEAVSVNLRDYMSLYINKMQNIKQGFYRRLQMTSDKLNSIASRPIFADGTQLFSSEMQHLDYTQEKLQKMMHDFTQNYSNQIALYAAKLHDKSPLVILSRGYSAAKDSQGNIVKSVNQINVNDKLDVRVADGLIKTNVESIEKIESNSI